MKKFLRGIGIKMREINFRAWDINEKKMKYENYFGSTADLLKWSYSYACELMQFTGLKDKNGKEIYIGDILNWDDECTILIKEKDELGFYYEVLTQKDKNICAFDIRFYRSEESAEIIGNKFEHSNLLGEIK